MHIYLYISIYIDIIICMFFVRLKFYITDHLNGGFIHHVNYNFSIISKNKGSQGHPIHIYIFFHSFNSKI